MTAADDPIYAATPRGFAPWLLGPMRLNKWSYVKVALAAVVINLIGVVTAIFAMVVYDRVLPNNAVDSLVALALGMVVILSFDLILRTLRAYFVDLAGVNVDRSVGEEAFERLATMRMASARSSTGATAGMLRELETLREFFASASLIALIDVPFIFLTLLVVMLIGGWVVLVPLAAIPIVIVVGLLTFPTMDRLSSEAMNHGLSKQGVLVETIGSLETVKATGATPLMKGRWMNSIDLFADIGTRQRLVGSASLNVANAVTSFAYVGCIVAGVFLIENGKLTMGGLVACSILVSRAIAPLTQIAQLLSRLAATKTAYRTLDPFMRSEGDGARPGQLRPARLDGVIEFRNVSFRYPRASENALTDLSFKIQKGEKVGFLGRIGSGKSTIARLMLGLYDATDGLILIDGTDIRQMDPDYLRRHLGASLQESVLFSGSIRENILLQRPETDDEELLRVARLTGTHDFIGKIVNGYDLRLADRGEGLSGGQRQSIALARALVGRPQALILDEPTSGMDQQSEQILMQRLVPEIADRTVILVTHRISLLRLAQRVIVLTDGRMQADGERDAVLRHLTQPVAA